VAKKMVRRRPSTSPSQMHDNAPNMAPRVYNAMTVPEDQMVSRAKTGCRKGASCLTLNSRVVMRLSSGRVNGVQLREGVDERLQGQHAARNSLIVAEAQKSRHDDKHNGRGIEP